MDELARRHSLSFRRGRHSEEASLGGLTLIKPQTFMNLSGSAVQAYATKLGLKPEQILLVHDDLDLPLGRLRFRSGGSAGGQGGVKDTIGKIGSSFHRLKIGIDRPPEGWRVEGWVLSRFKPEEEPLLAAVIGAAADALELTLAEGLSTAMNRYNGLDLRPPSAKEPSEPQGSQEAADDPETSA